MDHIRGAASSQLVLQLVQRAARECNCFHFAKAVDQVASVHKRRPSASDSAAFDGLLALADQRPQLLDHVAVAQTVYVAGVLQHRLTAEQQAEWQERVVQAFAHPQLHARNVSNALWGWSRLGLPLEGGLAAAADAAMARTTAGTKPQEVSNTLRAFATGGWLLSVGAAKALQQQLEQVLPQAAPQAVANSLWAVPKLGLRLSGGLQAAFAPAVQRIIPDAIRKIWPTFCGRAQQRSLQLPIPQLPAALSGICSLPAPVPALPAAPLSTGWAQPVHFSGCSVAFSGQTDPCALNGVRAAPATHSGRCAVPPKL